MSCGVGHRHSSDCMLLWLWCGLAAIVLIKSLAWESPYVAGAAQKKKKKKKKKCFSSLSCMVTLENLHVDFLGFLLDEQPDLGVLSTGKLIQHIYFNFQVICCIKCVCTHS